MAIRFDRIELSDDGNHLYPYIEGTDGYLYIRTTSGELKIGPGNSTYSHFYTDRGNFYFNRSTAFDGSVSAYGGDENLTNWNNVDAAQFRDKSNTGFYLDPASNDTSLKVAGAAHWDLEAGQYSGDPRAVVMGYSGGNYGQIGYNIAFTTTSGSHTRVFNDIPTRIDLHNGIVVYASSGGAAGTSISWTEVLEAQTDAFQYKGQDIYHTGNNSSILNSNVSLPTDFVSAANGGTFSGDIQATGIYVGSSNTSYDFYNNGTSYLNGAVTVDDNLTVTSGVATISQAATNLLTLTNTTNGGGAGVVFNDNSGGSQRIYLRGYHADGSSQGGGASLHLQSTEADLVFVVGDSSNTGRIVVKSHNQNGEVDYGFYSDTNTGMYSPAAGQVGLVSDGSRKLLVNNNGVYINNGNLYVPDHSIYLGNYIYHDGDTNTYVGFPSADTITLTAGGTERLKITGDVHVQGTTDLNINGSSRRLNFTAGTGTVRTTTANNLYLQSNSQTVLELKSNLESEFFGNIKVPEYIYHSGDTDTYIRFTNNAIGFRVEGSDVLLCQRYPASGGSGSFKGAYAPQGLVAANLGGANMIRKGTDVAVSGVREEVTWADGTRKVQAHASTGNGNSSNCYNWYSSENVRIDPEKDYEFSVWIKSTGDDHLYLGWHEYRADGTKISGNPYFHTSKIKTHANSNNSNTLQPNINGWVLLKYQLKSHRTTSGQSDTEGTDRYASSGNPYQTSGATGVMHSTTTHIHLRLGTCYGSVNGSKSYFYNPKITEAQNDDIDYIHKTVESCVKEKISVPQGKKILFDGRSGHTFITEESDSNLKFYVGNQEHLLLGGGDIYLQKPARMDSYLYHIGNTGTSMQYDTDNIKFRTGNLVRAEINNSGGIIASGRITIGQTSDAGSTYRLYTAAGGQVYFGGHMTSQSITMNGTLSVTSHYANVGNLDIVGIGNSPKDTGTGGGTGSGSGKLLGFNALNGSSRASATLGVNDQGIVMEYEKVFTFKISGNGWLSRASNPYKIIQAPGADKMIVVDEFLVYIDYETRTGVGYGNHIARPTDGAAYSVGFYENETGQAIGTAAHGVSGTFYTLGVMPGGFMNNTADRGYYRDVPVHQSALIANRSLFWKTNRDATSGNEPGGAHYVKIKYRVVDISDEFSDNGVNHKIDTSSYHGQYAHTANLQKDYNDAGQLVQ